MSQDHSSFKLSKQVIGEGNRPYIIAEISGNHLGSFDRAKRLIEIAKYSGADAVKLQTFNPSTITLPNDDPRFRLKSGAWEGQNLYELYKKTYTPWEWHKPLFDYANDLNIDIFSSPFDFQAVDLLSGLNAFAYKVASNEAHDWPLIQRIIQERKPIIISTGTSTKADFIRTIEFMRKQGSNNICILHCISAYPARLSEMSLNTISDIKKQFGLPVGISDHSLDIYASLASISMGASVIEKHITISREDDSPDSKFSLEPHELEQLCTLSKEIWEASNGKIVYGGDRDLENDSIFTRQLWSKSYIKANETLNWSNVQSIRAPSSEKGISTMDFEDVINRRIRIDIKENQPLKKDDLIN
ncbi:pseudaminic acid synthase [Prochlorococcus sp. MIT 1223]|uniref:pseudaminic acid synthase n=1 Tax=Prochlorococcus sp. MIT 1223 TaxID=3096217 RepID=UPI002A75E989|nr:pseudaminic acid synthase [Prochlorococcus sp. MIT 1223]